MQISKADLEAYRQTLIDIGNEAAEYVKNEIGDVRGRSVSSVRMATIDALTESIGIHGDIAQALAGQLFDEICEAEGINAMSYMYDDIIDLDMLSSKIGWLCRKLVDGDTSGYVDRVGVLADFYTKRCNYVAQMRNCHGANMRYARIPTGHETCDWCMMLASRGFVYYTEADAKAGNHQNCVVGDTEVFGSDVLGATRRDYQGALVHITATGGHELTVTPNHPILTTRGWVAANDIDDGDYLLCADLDHGDGVGVPDEHDAPPRIKDVFGAFAFLSSSGLNTMPTTAEDFHGDGTPDGEVDVVWADGLLKRVLDVARRKPPVHEGFADTHLDKTVGSSQLTSGGGSDVFVSRPLSASDGFVRGRGLSKSLLRGHPRSSDLSSGTTAPALNASVVKPSVDGYSRDPVAFGECVGTLTRLIALREVFGHDVSNPVSSANPCDIDADSLEMFAKDVWIASEFSGNAGEGLPSGIQLCRVIEKSVSVSACHVYNLTTSSSWYFANGIITHNCDCLCIPGRGGDSFNDATQVEGYDPDEYYRMWRDTDFMQPKTNPGNTRMVYNHDITSAEGYRNMRRAATRRIRRSSPTRGLQPQQTELYYRRMNSAATLEDLQTEYRDILNDLERRGDSVTDADWEDVGNHYAYLLETYYKKRRRR